MHEIAVKNFNIDAIANSGQIFRLVKDKKLKNTYHLCMGDRHLKIETDDFLHYRFFCNKKEFDKIYRKYFDIDFDYEKIKKIVREDDEYLKKSIECGKGLKILYQDPYEMLISFIISQRKSIKAIRTSIEKLCEYCGNKKKDLDFTYYTFPSPSEILKHKDKLPKCGLGYRVPYVIDACEKIVNGTINLKNKYIDKEYLKKIKGVGEKVASCIMLFAYHDLTSVPKDVHIINILNKYYNGDMPKEYQKYAGVIQQYLFNYDIAKN